MHNRKRHNPLHRNTCWLFTESSPSSCLVQHRTANLDSRGVALMSVAHCLVRPKSTDSFSHLLPAGSACQCCYVRRCLGTAVCKQESVTTNHVRTVDLLWSSNSSERTSDAGRLPGKFAMSSRGRLILFTARLRTFAARTKQRIREDTHIH
jgi:hypothetical protein